MNGTPSGGQASPSDGGGPPKSRLERLTDSLDRLNRLVKWQYVLVGAILFLIGIAVLTDNAVVRRLTDPPFARGLITFIIRVARIGLAFVLVCESFSPRTTRCTQQIRVAKTPLRFTTARHSSFETRNAQKKHAEVSASVLAGFKANSSHSTDGKFE